MLFRILLLLLPLSCLFAEDPWGKDSNLVKKKLDCCSNTQKFGTSSIEFFQKIISPIDGIRSHYRPSSSEYMRQSICKWGFFKGILLGCDRLLRENGDEWYYRSVQSDIYLMKYDPVD